MSEPIEKWKNLSVFEDGFQYKKDYYSFKDINSLEFQFVETNVTVNFQKAGKDYEAHLKINLIDGGPSITADCNGSITKYPKRSAELKSIQIYCVYYELAKRSYTYRINKYLEHLNNNGYFIYDSSKFYPDGRIISENKEANININTIKVIHDVLEIQIPEKENNKKKGFWNRLKELFSDNPNMYIEMSINKDCFYGLMEDLYKVNLGSRW